MIASSRRRSRWSWLSLSAVAAALLPVAGSPLQPRTTHASWPVAVVDPALTAAMTAATCWSVKNLADGPAGLPWSSILRETRPLAPTPLQ